MARPAFQASEPARLAREAIDRGDRPSPVPIAGWLGGKEWLEHTLAGRLIHTGAVIGDNELDILAGLHILLVPLDQWR